MCRLAGDGLKPTTGIETGESFTYDYIVPDAGLYWTVTNKTKWSHPFHLHGFFFQVLVFHCHILDHADGGLMGWVEVGTAQSSPHKHTP